MRQALTEVDVSDLLGEPFPGCEIGWAAVAAGGDTRGLLAEADHRLLLAKRRLRQ